MDKELEALREFNKKFPKDIRCTQSIFDDGLFERGFIAGFLAAQKDIPADIAKVTNDHWRDLLL